MRKHAWLITNIALCLVTVTAGYFVLINRQAIQDWWTLRGYTPSAQIKQLADDTAMIGMGRDVFYVSGPQVEDSDAFNMHCAQTGEKSLVLGCYNAQRIYVYNVSDTRLAGVTQVTAAHEMLHAAYERLDSATRSKVNAMIEAELPKVTDQRLRDLIKIYNQSEPGQLNNEMHSILGTEYGNLSPELEKYYQKYFNDRSKVVAYAAQYEAVFTASKNKITELEARLDALKKQIDANAAIITTTKAALDARIQAMSELRATDPAAYNKQVPGYNADVRSYNSLVITTRGLVDTYNQLVIDRNSEAAAQNDLYHSLNSRYQTVSN